ncbi:MAG: tyrosine-type recombinase/integrase [Actinobacteria bacterium]|nr:tyrosine-type recombinase/integrase [Actinomycetota bacterium]
MRGLFIVLWRAGLRIHEALTLGEADLDQRRGALLVQRNKGGRRREVGMDEWAWEQLQRWLEVRGGVCPARPQVGPVTMQNSRPGQFGARSQLRQVAALAGVRHRFAMHQLRHADVRCFEVRVQRPRRTRTPCAAGSSGLSGYPMTASASGNGRSPAAPRARSTASAAAP